MSRARAPFLVMRWFVPGTLPALAFAALGLFVTPAGASFQYVPPAKSTADTLRLSVNDAVVYAREHANDVQNATAGIEAAEGQVREAKSYALPNISGSVEYKRQFQSIYSTTVPGDTSGLADLFANSPFGSANSWNAQLTGSQMIWGGGRVGAGINAARAVRRSTHAARDQVRGDVARDVREAYYNAVYAGALVDIAQAGLDAARDQLRQVDALYKQGTRAEYDLIRAQVDARNQEPVLVSARNAQVLAQLELKQRMNLPLEQPLALTTGLAFPDSMVPVPDEPGYDGHARAAMARADADVEARRQLLNVEKAQRWPELSLNGTFGQQAFPSDPMPTGSDFRRNLDASLKLDFPLFLGGRTFGTVQRANAEYEQARIAREAQRQAVDLDVARSRQDVRRTLATLVARRGTQRLAVRAYQLASVRYTNGLTTQFEVTNARVDAQRAAANEVEAVRDYMVALADLEHAVGRPVRTSSRPLDEVDAWINAQGQ